MKARTADVIIGLDVGTTAVKVAAFGVGGAPGMLAKALAELGDLLRRVSEMETTTTIFVGPKRLEGGELRVEHRYGHEVVGAGRQSPAEFLDAAVEMQDRTWALAPLRMSR